MITIFTIPYKFEGIFKVRQENAIQCWQRIVKDVEIILFCDDSGVDKAAKQFGCVHVPDIGRNQWGTPLVSDAFMKAQEVAKYDVMAWLNADILVNEAWAKAVLACAEKFPQFLAVGQRWDTPSIDKPLDFSGNEWWNHVLLQVKSSGKLHSVGGIDNFAFRRGLYKEMPPFAVGKSSWDNWLVADPVNKRFPVINVTPACVIVHQGAEKGKVVTEERKANRALAGQKLATIKNASWLMTSDFQFTLPSKTKAGRKPAHKSAPSRGKPEDVKPRTGKTGTLKVTSLRPLVVQWDFVNPLGSTMEVKHNHVGYEIRFASGRVVQRRRTVTNVQSPLKPGHGFSVKISPSVNLPSGEYELWFDFLHGNKWGERLGFEPIRLLMLVDRNGRVSVR